MKRRNFISNLTVGAVSVSGLPIFINTALKEKSTGNGGVQEVLTYIRNNWEKSVSRDEPGRGVGGVDLPYPYTTPSIRGEGEFSIFFYWDTYFTNLGLLRNGKEEQAKNNIRNILFLVREQGYMPNFVGIHNRSQSPYLHLMIRDYLDKTGIENDDFYRECAEGVRKEYQFWMTARYSKTGLNHFGHQDDEKGCIDFYNQVLIDRLKFDPNIPDRVKSEIGGHYMAEAENWDFNQRYGGRCLDHAAVDLNALLFGYEEFLYKAAGKNNWNFKKLYSDRLEKRKELINKYLWNEEKGWFFDYDFINGKQSDVYSLSGLQPMFFRIATPEQAEKMVKNLPLFEREFGMATTNERPGCREFQWAFPVVWPPLAYITVMSLDMYGYKKDAQRIARKFIDVNTRLYKKTGRLFEKTDAETGELSNAEYSPAPMMGWTAGVFAALAEYLGLS
jgi:alpha,alpha-trehalase